MTNTAEVTQIPFFVPGDFAQVHPMYAGKHRGITFVVDKIPGGSRVKMTAHPLLGGQGISGRPELFIDNKHEAWIGDRHPEVPTGPGFRRGSVVTYTDAPGLWVIVKVSGQTFDIAPLGGDPERGPGFRVSGTSKFSIVTGTITV